jgi:hypothetical protein
MSQTIKLLRGLETDRSGISPAEGVIFYTKDNLRLFVGNGTAGGQELAYVHYEVDGSGNPTQNVVISGNLTVSGTTTTVNSNEVNIGDAVILLNADEAGAPSQNGGIEIERGTSANVSLVWDETNDYWVVNDGVSSRRILDTADVLSSGNVITISGGQVNHDSVTRNDGTDTASNPAIGGSFDVVSSITTSAEGHITAVNTKTVTLPDSDNTDTTYSVSAETATGGAAVRLTGSDASTDNVNFVAGAGMAITRTDADTITVTCTTDGITDLGYTASPTNGIVTSSTGTDATIPLANGTNAGLLSPTLYTKLNSGVVTSVGAGAGLSNSGTATAPILDVNVDGTSIIISSDTLSVNIVDGGEF